MKEMAKRSEHRTREDVEERECCMRGGIGRLIGKIVYFLARCFKLKQHATTIIL